MPLTGSTATWKRRVRDGPRQKRLTGRTRSRAIPTAPGSTIVAAGVVLNVSSRSGSEPATVASTGMLPRLSTGTSWLAPNRPCDVRGLTSAEVSLNGPISSVASSTTEPDGSSFEAARIPSACGPGWVDHSRGGRMTKVAVPSLPGKRDRLAGSIVVQPAASPSTSRLNWSTTVPVLRIVTTPRTSPPGSTSR